MANEWSRNREALLCICAESPCHSSPSLLSGRAEARQLELWLSLVAVSGLSLKLKYMPKAYLSSSTKLKFFFLYDFCESQSTLTKRKWLFFWGRVINEIWRYRWKVGERGEFEGGHGHTWTRSRGKVILFKDPENKRRKEKKRKRRLALKIKN